MPNLVETRNATILAVVIGILGMPLHAAAKCPTAYLRITGNALVAPLIVDDPEFAGQFNIWNGPGVRVNEKPIHLDSNRPIGAFIDWPSGPIDERPGEGLSFSVKFFCIREGSGSKRMVYEVDYLIDDSDNGYIFLPGEGDPRYRFNTFSIAHGVEGNWFRASPEWERLIRPMIVQAITPKAEAT